LKDPDIDAVSITTMWDQHTDPTLAALAAGKHVFLEKPMASTVADCQRICDAAASARGNLMVGHICRFNPRFVAAKREMESGSLGKILSLSARRNIPAAWTPEILNKIGPIMGDTIHDTDLILWLTGDKSSAPFHKRSICVVLNIPMSGRPCTALPPAPAQLLRLSGACRRKRRSPLMNACR
jgi:UDP-N-acetylglucosamine 3-dehydrogenase